MKVFVSWSGDRSKKLALALFEWLKVLFPSSVEPWMSARSVQAGQWWISELHGSIRDAEFGILCLTPENIDSNWILFEAGALMMTNNNNNNNNVDGGTSTLKIGHVIPMLLGLRKTDLEFPLAQSQAVEADRQGFWELALAAIQSLPESERRSKIELNTKLTHCG